MMSRMRIRPRAADNAAWSIEKMSHPFALTSQQPPQIGGPMGHTSVSKKLVQGRGQYRVSEAAKVCRNMSDRIFLTCWAMQKGLDLQEGPL